MHADYNRSTCKRVYKKRRCKHKAHKKHYNSYNKAGYKCGYTVIYISAEEHCKCAADYCISYARNNGRIKMAVFDFFNLTEDLTVGWGLGADFARERVEMLNPVQDLSIIVVNRR